MSYTAPYITISVASPDQIKEGIELLTALLGCDIQDVTPNDADTPHSKNDSEGLTPQQKAAITRAKNKAAKEAEAEAAAAAAEPPPIHQPATPAAPTTASAPASPQAPGVPAPATPEATAPATAPQSGVIDYNSMSKEAFSMHQALSMKGRGGEIVALLAKYGVQRLDDLPAEQWGNFVNDIRAIQV